MNDKSALEPSSIGGLPYGFASVRDGAESDVNAVRIWAKPPLTVFIENGFAGVKNADGEIVIPPKWGRIEVSSDHVWARVPGYSVSWWKSGGSGSESSVKDNHFYRNGMVGLLKDGKVWFDAIYDDIYDWGKEFDVVYTRIGKVPRYFTGDHQPILTHWRKFPKFPNEEMTPYYVYEADNTSVLVTMEPADIEDAQTCRRNGRLYRLDRMRRCDIRPFIEGRSHIRTLPQMDLADFDSVFTYIYSAYSARATGPDAVVECLRRFRDMGCYNSSWSRLMLLSVSPKRTERLDVTALFRVVDGEAVQGRFGYSFKPTGTFAAGFDDALAVDEIRIFLVQYFSDHWPAPCEFQLATALDSWSPAAIRNAREEIARFAADNSNFQSSEQQAAFRLQYQNSVEPVPVVAKNRSWRTIRTVCRELMDDGWRPSDFAWRLCAEDWNWLEESDVVAIRENQLRLLHWALDNGADPNFVRDGKSCLDALSEIGKDLGRFGCTPKKTDERRRFIEEMKGILLKADAKPGAELPAMTLPVYLYPQSRMVRHGRFSVRQRTKDERQRMT